MWPGRARSARPGPRIDRRQHCRGAIAGRDAGAGARLRLDRHRERGRRSARCSRRPSAGCRARQPLLEHRHADQAAPVRGHEVDRLRRDLLGRNRQIAFVLPILVVDHDDHLAARADRIAIADASIARTATSASAADRVADWFFMEIGCVRLSSTARSASSRMRHSRPAAASSARTTYLPRISDSRLTAGPARIACRLVCCHVNGMICTLKRRVVQVGDGQADAVDGDRPLPHDVAARARADSEIVSQYDSPCGWTASRMPVASTWPWTKCPPSRAPALSGPLEVQQGPGLRRPHGRDPRVSAGERPSDDAGARRAVTTVRQTPLTARLSPGVSSARERRLDPQPRTRPRPA